jgi:hypothetical protein
VASSVAEIGPLATGQLGDLRKLAARTPSIRIPCNCPLHKKDEVFAPRRVERQIDERHVGVSYPRGERTRISQMALSFRHGVCAFSPENPAFPTISCWNDRGTQWGWVKCSQEFIRVRKSLPLTLCRSSMGFQNRYRGPKRRPSGKDRSRRSTASRTTPPRCGCSTTRHICEPGDTARYSPWRSS